MMDVCPICNYPLDGCQCRFGGSAHPDRHDNTEVVLHHLHLLTPAQLAHIIELERYWDYSYSDSGRTKMVSNLKDHGSTY